MSCRSSVTMMNVGGPKPDIDLRLDVDDLGPALCLMELMNEQFAAQCLVNLAEWKFDGSREEEMHGVKMQSESTVGISDDHTQLGGSSDQSSTGQIDIQMKKRKIRQEETSDLHNGLSRSSSDSSGVQLKTYTRNRVTRSRVIKKGWDIESSDQVLERAIHSSKGTREANVRGRMAEQVEPVEANIRDRMAEQVGPAEANIRGRMAEQVGPAEANIRGRMVEQIGPAEANIRERMAEQVGPTEANIRERMAEQVGPAEANIRERMAEQVGPAEATIRGRMAEQVGLDSFITGTEIHVPHDPRSSSHVIAGPSKAFLEDSVLPPLTDQEYFEEVAHKGPGQEQGCSRTATRRAIVSSFCICHSSLNGKPQASSALRWKGKRYNRRRQVKKTSNVMVDGNNPG